MLFNLLFPPYTRILQGIHMLQGTYITRYEVQHELYMHEVTESFVKYLCGYSVKRLKSEVPGVVSPDIVF